MSLDITGSVILGTQCCGAQFNKFNRSNNAFTKPNWIRLKCKMALKLWYRPDISHEMSAVTLTVKLNELRTI